MTFEQNTKIAFLGMGLMGRRMSLRLIQAGFQVAVWNRSAAACETLVAAGAKLLDLNNHDSDQAQHTLSQCAVIMLCLADDAAVAAVYEKIAPQLQAGQVIIDFSSLSVKQTQTLAAQAAEQQVRWIDSPVSGGTTGAENGSLVVFAGGDGKTIEALSAVYAAIAQRVTHMGGSGAGQATKICNQLIVAANSTLIAEAVALAQRAGVDAHLLAPALADGFADSKPLQILAPRMAAQCFEPVQWKVKTLSKDLANAVQLASDYALDIPVATRALQQLQQHQSEGHAEHDLSSIIHILQP